LHILHVGDTNTEPANIKETGQQVLRLPGSAVGPGSFVLGVEATLRGPQGRG
jgi:hypothetical protein